MDLEILNLKSLAAEYGYRITTNPVEGMEAEAAAELRADIAKLEAHAVYLRGKFGYRGLSKKLVARLVADLGPNPYFGFRAI